MAIKRKEIKVYFEKTMIFCIRTSYRFARDHPFVFGLVLFLLVLYRSFPSLFAFLVSSCPVIVCTTLLLGLLLSYGEPNIPKIEEEEDISFMSIENPADHFYVKGNENLIVENHVENRTYNEEIAARETILHDEKASADEDIYHATKHYEGNKKLDTIMDASSLNEEVMQERYDEDKVIQENEHQVQGVSKSRDLYVGKLGVGVCVDVADVGKNVSSFGISDKQETEGLELEIGEPELDHHFDSSLGLSWQSIDNHNASSDSESDGAESSSPDASMTDIMPMLDELHPLLNSEDPQHVSISKSDAASRGSSLDHEPDDNSTDEEDDNNGVEEDEEVQEEKDDGTEAAVKWTEDDQKNVMDLGSSELERNRRLECLIAKRRARKNLTFVMGRNLIDLDANFSSLSMEELSRFRVQVPPRRNPFDAPYDSEETMDLPPIPGSAPSSLLPRRNPFDLFYDQQEQDSHLTGETWGHQDFVSAPHREMLFRRNESFSLERKEVQQERHHSRLKPYFVAEKMDSEEGCSTFQRQFSDKRKSKVSSILESDTASSITEHEHRGEPEEQECHQETELSSLSKHDADDVDHESCTFAEVKSVDIEEEKAEHLTSGLENDVDTDLIIQESYQVVENFGAVEEDIREEIHSHLPISDSEKLEVFEKKHDELNEDEKGFETTFYEQSSNLEHMRNLRGESDYLTSVDRVYDYKVAEPVYDSSPQAAGTSFSKLSTVDENLPDAGQGVNANSSVKFNKQKEFSELGSFPMPFEGNAASGIGDLISLNTGVEEASDDIVVEESQVSTFNLLISEENREDFEQKEEDPGFRNHDQVVHLTGLQMNEEVRILESDIEHEISFFQKSRQETGRLDDNDKLFLKPEENTADFFPAVPIYDGSLTGIQLIELTESMDLIVSKMKTQIGSQSCSGPSMSRDGIKSAALTKHEAGSLKMVDSSDEESDEIHPVVLYTDEMDEILATEMDEDVNFRMAELSSNHQGSELMFRVNGLSEDIGSGSRSSFVHDRTQLQFSEDRSTLHADMSVSELSRGSFGNSQEVHSAVSEPGTLELETGSSFSSNRNLEHTVYNPKIHVLEASLIQEVDSASNQLLEEPAASIVSVSHIPKLITANPDLELNERHMDQAIADSGLLVVEASSVEDIHLTFKQISEENQLDIETSKVDGTQRSMNQTMADSEMLVVEARSVEDIHSAFKQISEENRFELGSSEIATAETSMHATVTDSELLVVEATSVKDIHSAFKQTSEESQLDLKLSNIDTARSMKQTVTDSEMVVVEARSVEDIHSVFKQISEGSLDEPLYDEVGSQSLQETVYPDAKQLQSDLLVVEAKSIEDIDIAFSQLSHSTSKKAPEVMETMDGSLEVNAHAGHLETEVLEVKSADEISSASKEPVASETSSSMELSGENPGAERMSDVSASRSLTTRKTQKKHKRRKSVSSSSSSDSDFHENKQEED